MQELEQPADNARIITTRPDIVALLRGLSGNRCHAHISFFNSTAQLSGKITHINSYFDEVIFAEEEGVDVSFPPGKASLITVLSSIKAQFHAERVEPTEFEGKPALRVRIPKMMFCSERRESERIRPSSEAPLEVLFADQKNTDGDMIAMKVMDIGVGGVAIMVNPLKIEIVLGKELKNCGLSLPGIGEVVFDLTIQNTTEVSDSNSVANRRCGCRFSKISPGDKELIRRYIEQLKS